MHDLFVLFVRIRADSSLLGGTQADGRLHSAGRANGLKEEYEIRTTMGEDEQGKNDTRRTPVPNGLVTVCLISLG